MNLNAQPAHGKTGIGMFFLGIGLGAGIPLLLIAVG